MPLCSTCGLSISETAQFCPTCGTRAAGESAPGVVTRPTWAAADAAPPTDGFAPPDPIAPPSTTGQPALHRNRTRLAITAAAAVLVVVLVAVFAHDLVTGFQGARYTQDMARQIHPGLSLAQVEAITGGPPTSRVYNRTIPGLGCFWTNADGSQVWAHFTNNAVDRVDFYTFTSSRGATSLRFANGTAGLNAVLAVLAAVVFGACLFVATKLFGYSISVNQVILFAVVTGVVRLVPYAGGLLALLVGAALIERWSSAGWWTALLIILAAGFITGVLTAAVVGVGFGLGLGL